MEALEFIAKDRAGLLLTEVNGEVEWLGTQQQFKDAEFNELFFLNEGFWCDKVEVF